MESMDRELDRVERHADEAKRKSRNGFGMGLAGVITGGLGFVGIAPSFKLKLEGMIHYSAAVVCCVSAIIWLLLSGNYPIVIWWGGICLILYLQFGRWCWWLEVGVIGGVISALA